MLSFACKQMFLNIYVIYIYIYCFSQIFLTVEDYVQQPKYLWEILNFYSSSSWLWLITLNFHM